MRGFTLSLVLLVVVGLITAPNAEAQRRRRRATTGNLVISTDVVGAEVLVDEESVGYTPLEPVPLPPGSHTVRVRKPGFTQFDEVIDIEAGEDLPLAVDIIALAMILTVRSTPDEARVFVDGTFRGQTPIELELIDGEHSLRITAPRFHESVQTITARPGQTDLLDVTLEELPAELIEGRPPEWYEEPLTWILVGSGAAVVAAGIIIAVVLTSGGSPFSTFCGADEQDCLIVARPGWTF